MAADLQQRLAQARINRLFWVILGIGWACLIALLAIDLPRMLINASAGCWPWSPRVVEYHDNMTLCPGQRARIRFIVPIMPARKDIIAEERDDSI